MRLREFIPENDKTEEMKIQEENEGKVPFFATAQGKVISAFLMAAVIGAFIVLRLGSGGDITCQLDESKLGVTCLAASPVFLNYDEIETVELIDAFEMGDLVQAADWDGGWCGTYENEDYGVYTLYAYASTEKFILVSDGEQTLVFNKNGEKETRNFYEEICERV